MEKIVLIDGNSLINRAFYAVSLLTNKDGVYTNAVYGFVNMLLKVVTDTKPKYLAVAFDVKAPTFRHKMYAEYKAGRRAMPEELKPQFATLKEILKKMNIKIIEQEGIEADDILGTLSKRFQTHTVILTGDRDALQLVDDSTEVWLTKKGLSEIERVTEENIKQLFGVDAAGIIELKSLMGDASDNIPGVMGVGEVTAVKLLGEYKTLDGVYENISNIKGKLAEKLTASKENAYLSHTLATIKTDCGLDVTLDDCRYDFPFRPAVEEAFRELQFNSLLKRESLFAREVIESREAASCERIGVNDAAQFNELIKKFAGGTVAVNFASDITVACDETAEYVVSVKTDLLGDGMAFDDAVKNLYALISSAKVVVTFDAKQLKKKMNEYVPVDNFDAEDIALMSYILGSTPTSAAALLEKYGFHEQGNIAVNMLRLYGILTEEIQKRGIDALYQTEKGVSQTLFAMEQTGCRVDVAVLNELKQQYNAKITELEQKIYQLAGRIFNINSPKQLGVLLFEELGLKAEKKTKTGYSTDIDVLEALENRHPIITPVIEYRQYIKLQSTYIDGLQSRIGSDGRLHTEYKQFLTMTGRLSSTDPNLQNIPSAVNQGGEIRRMFVSQFEGGILVSADYSQIELRLLAHLSGDEALIKAFNNGFDVHTSTAALMFGVDTELVTPHMRKQAKAINFGIIYGKGDFSLAKELGIYRNEAKAFIERYFANYPSVKGYLNGIIESAKQSGEVRTMFGRIRNLPEIKSSNYVTRSHAERAATNMPLQGSSADIIKMAMVKVQQTMLKEKLQSKLILQVHDELIVDCVPNEAQRVSQLLKTTMEGVATLKVPLTVEVETGKNWYEI